MQKIKTCKELSEEIVKNLLDFTNLNIDYNSRLILETNVESILEKWVVAKDNDVISNMQKEIDSLEDQIEELKNGDNIKS